jgi:hypothetical protein
MKTIENLTASDLLDAAPKSNPTYKPRVAIVWTVNGVRYHVWAKPDLSGLIEGWLYRQNRNGTVVKLDTDRSYNAIHVEQALAAAKDAGVVEALRANMGAQREAAAAAQAEAERVAKIKEAGPELLAALELIAGSDGFMDGTSVKELQFIARSAIAKLGDAVQASPIANGPEIPHPADLPSTLPVDPVREALMRLTDWVETAQRMMPADMLACFSDPIPLAGIALRAYDAQHNRTPAGWASVEGGTVEEAPCTLADLKALRDLVNGFHACKGIRAWAAEENHRIKVEAITRIDAAIAKAEG